MVEHKKQLMEERLGQIHEACLQLVEAGEFVNYESVSTKTGIPKRTLQHEHYASLIARFRTGVPSPNPDRTSLPELAAARKEAELWRARAEKLEVMVKELSRLLAERGIKY